MRYSSRASSSWTSLSFSSKPYKSVFDLILDWETDFGMQMKPCRKRGKTSKHLQFHWEARETRTRLLKRPSKKNLSGSHGVSLRDLLDDGVVELEGSNERSPSL